MSWKIRLALLLWVSSHQLSTAQAVAAGNSMFWEVSGNGLPYPSYLFGTLHLLGKSHIDTLPNVLSKFNESSLLVGEVEIDSAGFKAIMEASLLRGTTLDKLLDADLYRRTAAWLYEISGYDLQTFNTLNPMTVQIYLMVLHQQKYSPNAGATEVAMDQYFQQMARQRGKAVHGLETVNDQIHALYDQFSYQRQAELLAACVADKDKFSGKLAAMNRYYLDGNLAQLESLLHDEYYDAAEVAVMLDDRNRSWMRQLPALFQQQRTFVAVGALHLATDQGLIAQLRKLGYQVKPLPLR